MTTEKFSPTIKFTLPVDPIPLGRPRFSRGRTYLPKRSRDYREVLQAAAADFMHELGLEPLTGDLSCRFEFYRKFKAGCRNFGDLDNHVKATLDGLQGVAFADDAAVVELVAVKGTDRLNPRSVIEIKNVAKC